MEFEKYLKQGAYHWDATSRHPGRHVAFTAARYTSILQHVPNWKNQRVLDIACGDCRMSAYAASAGARVVGIDCSLAGIQVGKKRWQKEQPGTLSSAFFIQADGLKLPVADQSCDVVIASEIIEHVENPRAFLGQVARTIRPHGTLILTTPFRLTETPLDPFHVHEYFPNELQAIASEFFGEIDIHLSHPAWVISLFTLGGWFRPFRWTINGLSILGKNPFLHFPLGRYPGQITLIAKKPIWKNP
jgi:2-polyprenyl-3-methyl-5-hydroxy-6-metoxy-1,4-benzoquinol methylase